MAKFSVTEIGCGTEIRRGASFEHVARSFFEDLFGMGSHGGLRLSKKEPVREGTAWTFFRWDGSPTPTVKLYISRAVSR